MLLKRAICTVMLLSLGWTTQAKEGIRCGTVRCGRQAVAGVVVTDGTTCVKSDKQGHFALPANDKAQFIYLSTPAGYTSPQEQGVVRFYRTIESHHTSYDFDLSPATSEQTHHGFVVVADPQIFARKEFRLLEGSAEDIRQSVQSRDIPFHGICVGDIVSSDHSLYPEYNRIMATTGLAFRNAMGNHDMKIWGRSHEESQQAYQAMYGPCYYSYNVGKIHYVVLNDNFFIGREWYYIGYLEEQQLAWLEEDLKYVPAASTVVVALHIPTMYKDKDSLPFDYKMAERSLCNYKALYKLLEPYKVHILSGHMHTTTNSIIGPGLYEHNIAALSGAWWQGSICTDGTPAGYGLFEVDGDEITWSYKSTGFPPDFQLRVYDQVDDAAFAGHIVANVWNCDPTWHVEMCVDGGTPIPMERITAVDPCAKALYADPAKLDHKWITTTPSDHFYSAPAPTRARNIEIRARDGFGNIFRTEKIQSIK